MRLCQRSRGCSKGSPSLSCRKRGERTRLAQSAAHRNSCQENCQPCSAAAAARACSAFQSSRCTFTCDGSKTNDVALFWSASRPPGGAAPLRSSGGGSAPQRSDRVVSGCKQPRAPWPRVQGFGAAQAGRRSTPAACQAASAAASGTLRTATSPARHSSDRRSGRRPAVAVRRAWRLRRGQDTAGAGRRGAASGKETRPEGFFAEED